MKNTPSKSLNKDLHGVSVVIGALMLTVIVVSAAASFAVFTAQKQKEIQNAEFAQLLQDSELLRVDNINELIFDDLYEYVENISFTVSSGHTRTSTITSIKITSGTYEGYVINFSIDRITRNIDEKWHLRPTGYKIYYSDETYDENMSLDIEPNELILIKIQNVTGNVSGLTIERNDPITIHIYSRLTNDFSKSFIPPTPNIQINQESENLILDGSTSFTEDDATIVQYEWNLTNMKTDTSLPLMYGRKINANRILIDDENVSNFEDSKVNWNISLKIINNYGMIGIKNFTYTQDFFDVMSEIEILDITDIKPVYNKACTKINTLTLTFQNEHRYASNISILKINNQQNINITNSVPLNVSSYQSTDSIKMNVSDLDIQINQPIMIKYKTELGNTFEETFFSPNALIRIQIESLPAGGGNVYVLDGSLSEDPSNGYIIKWNWTITNITGGGTDYTNGKKVQYDFQSGVTYEIILKVTDNYNVMGKTKFTYDVP